MQRETLPVESESGRKEGPTNVGEASQHTGVESEALAGRVIGYQRSLSETLALGESEREEHDLFRLRHNQLRSSEGSELDSSSCARDPRYLWALRLLVDNSRWGAIWSSLILLNLCFIIAEEEYVGMRLGHALGIFSSYGSQEYVDKWWPGAADFFKISEITFAALFTFELACASSFDVLNFLHKGPHLFRSPFWRDQWELMDAVVVICADLSLLRGFVEMPFNVQLLRALRFAKLLQLVKLLRKFQAFDPMVLIGTALEESIGSILAALVVLFVIITIPAVLLPNILRATYLDLDMDGQYSQLPRQTRDQLFLYFGTYGRSMVSMLELALANWPPIARFMMEDLHFSLGVFCVTFKLIVGFAVSGVINAVFVRVCFHAADTDDVLLVRNRQRSIWQHKEKMTRLFKFADRQGHGYLTRSEFKCVLQKSVIKTWLEAMDLRYSDADALFTMLVGPDGRMTAEQLIRGVARLRGAARNLDMLTLLSLPMFSQAKDSTLFPDSQERCDDAMTQVAAPLESTTGSQ